MELLSRALSACSISLFSRLTVVHSSELLDFGMRKLTVCATWARPIVWVLTFPLVHLSLATPLISHYPFA